MFILKKRFKLNIWLIKWSIGFNFSYVDEMEQYLKEKKPSVIYLNDGVNSDSGLRPEKIDLPFL